MSKTKILTALLLSYLACSYAEEKPAQKRIDDIMKPPPFILVPSQAPTETPSYFSKISNWLKSFGEPEKKTTVIRTSLPPGPPIPTFSSFTSGPPGSFPGPPKGSSPFSNGPPQRPPKSFPRPPNGHGPPPFKSFSGPHTTKLFPGPTISSPSNYSPTPTFSSPAQFHSPPSTYDRPAFSKPAPSKNIQGPILDNHLSGSGSLQAQETSNSHQYLPPNPSNRDCNPCNKEPWIPIVGKYGSKTLIGFVPNVGNNERPNGVYGAPNQPTKQYGPPPNNQYGPPPNNQNGPSPSNQYGPPPSNQYGPPSNNQNGPSPSNQYGPPPSNQYSPPSNNQNGPSLSNQYGSPPSNQYGAPNHGGISDVIKPPSDTYGVPSSGYGQPKPAFLPTPNTPNKYGPPRRPRPNFPSPNLWVGPPPTSSKYGPPSSNFGGNYKPSGPSDAIVPPPSSAPVSSYGPPPSQKPSNHYRPPPTNSYGPPPSGPTGNYGPPPSAPTGNYGAPQIPSNNYGAPQSFPTPTASSNNYDFTSINSFKSSKHNQGTFVTPVPQSSYGPPPAGPAQNRKPQLTSDEYLPPPHELPISTGNENYDALSVPPLSQPSTYNSAIAFPNMSPSFVAPIRNAHQFKQTSPSAVDNLPSQGVNIPFHTGKGISGSNVQITQSVPIADFISTIEYPPNVVQSPIIDLVVNDNLENTEDENKSQVNLKDNPIVVDSDEHHQEASDNHPSVAVHDTLSPKLKFTPSLINTIRDTEPTQSVIKPQEFKNTSIKTDVQIDPSLQTLLHDENLAAIIAKQLLSENNNPPKPFEASENSLKKSQVNQNAQATNNALFTHPTIDYSNWNPSVGGLSTGMQPPAPSQSWSSTNNYVQYTTKKPKQIQIIVPYITNNKGSNWHQKDLRGSTSSPNNPAISLFGKLPSAEESQWTKYIDHNFQESKTSFSQTPSPISNIQDFFKDTSVNIDASQNLPFDILKLQKNIDVWTEQEFNKMRYDALSSTTTRFAYSKKIPDEYLTTQSITHADEVTTNAPNNRNSKLFHHDYLASGSAHHSIETGPHNLTELANIDSNLVEDNIEKARTTTPASWDKIQVSISPLTNERVYVVTPLSWDTEASTPKSAWSYVPKNEIREINKQLADNANFVFNSPRFSVRPEPAQTNKSKEDFLNKINLVYGDWPELINGLATTTEGKVATSQKASEGTTTAHPLLGRMDISEHTAGKEGTVQTYTGHSKVVTAVTTSVAKKKTGIEDKKFTTTSKKPPATQKE